jgi:hypothetical protein
MSITADFHVQRRFLAEIGQFDVSDPLAAWAGPHGFSHLAMIHVAATTLDWIGSLPLNPNFLGRL